MGISWFYCVHRRTWPGPATGIAGYAGRRSDGKVNLVDRHGGGDGLGALPAHLPLYRMGCRARPRANCLAASDRSAARAGIS